VTRYQPPAGISAPTVTNIPEKWSAAWFRRFITQHLEAADVRNAVPGPGISIQTSAANPQRGALTARPIISAGGASGVPVSSIEPMPPFTVVANDTNASASPAPINEIQLTSMVQPFSAGASGAVPASGGGTQKFLRADGAFATVPPPAPPVQVGSFLADDYVPDDWIVPPGPTSAETLAIRPYAPGSFAIPNGSYGVMARTLRLTGTQTGTLKGNAVLRIT
jgi:hypothetical protein